MAWIDAAGDGKAELPRARLQQIEQHEREVAAVAGQGRGDPLAHGRDGARIRDTRREVVQQLEPALADDLLRLLGDRAEQSADPAVVAGNGTVREREIGFLAVAVALHEEQQVLVEGRLPVQQDGIGARADLVPDLGPHVAPGTAQRRRVARPEHRDVGVVVDVDELSPPPHEHGIARGQHDADRRLQALRPGLRRAERRPGPVVAPHQRAHLAATGEKIRLGAVRNRAFVRGAHRRVNPPCRPAGRRRQAARESRTRRMLRASAPAAPFVSISLARPTIQSESRDASDPAGPLPFRESSCIVCPFSTLPGTALGVFPDCDMSVR